MDKNNFSHFLLGKRERDLEIMKYFFEFLIISNNVSVGCYFFLFAVVDL